jgi:hypothetical protein
MLNSLQQRNAHVLRSHRSQKGLCRCLVPISN